MTRDAIVLPELTPTFKQDGCLTSPSPAHTAPTLHANFWEGIVFQQTFRSGYQPVYGFAQSCAHRGFWCALLDSYHMRRLPPYLSYLRRRRLAIFSKNRTTYSTTSEIFLK